MRFTKKAETTKGGLKGTGGRRKRGTKIHFLSTIRKKTKGKPDQGKDQKREKLA